MRLCIIDEETTVELIRRQERVLSVSTDCLWRGKNTGYLPSALLNFLFLSYLSLSLSLYTDKQGYCVQLSPVCYAIFKA